jgi:hypothetical protein
VENKPFFGLWPSFDLWLNFGSRHLFPKPKKVPQKMEYRMAWRVGGCPLFGVAATLDFPWHQDGSPSRPRNWHQMIYTQDLHSRKNFKTKIIFIHLLFRLGLHVAIFIFAFFIVML